jgi:3-oxosteroid 1-dehydrogenase
MGANASSLLLAHEQTCHNLVEAFRDMQHPRVVRVSGDHVDERGRDQRLLDHPGEQVVEGALWLVNKDLERGDVLVENGDRQGGSIGEVTVEAALPHTRSAGDGCKRRREAGGRKYLAGRLDECPPIFRSGAWSAIRFRNGRHPSSLQPDSVVRIEEKPMTTHWDREVDVLVAGSGAAGLTAAITAADAGKTALIVESTDRWGGTTMLSGGGLWMPANPLMKKLGIPDSRADALNYMQEAIGDAGPASSIARREAFVDTVPRVFNLLAGLGVRWCAAKDYPDYYPDRPGGRTGRGIEVQPFNAKRLGEWVSQSRANQSMPAPLRTDDVWLLSRAWSTPSGFVRGARFVFRTLGGVVTGKRLYGLGAALVMTLMEIVQRQGTEVLLSSPITELVLDNGRVVGAIVTTPSGPLRIRARNGVILGAGGFAQNQEWRQKYHGMPGNSSAAAGDQGTAIDVGVRAGGALSLMDDAWWGSAVPMPDGTAQFMLSERSMPYGIIVDQAGSRYTNESQSYIDFGHDMINHHRETPTIPSWMILDIRHRRRYLSSALLAGGKSLRASGIVVSADTIEELAQKLDINPVALRATVTRFNGFATTGVDEDFARGRTVYDNYYGDPSVKPNPNLGPLEKGPFTAVKVVPGDLGTKGGLLTDEHARVLTDAGAPIPGLYAAGNTTASVMGHTYPGPGSTIAPAVVFGYLAAVHAATTSDSTAPAETVIHKEKEKEPLV